MWPGAGEKEGTVARLRWIDGPAIERERQARRGKGADEFLNREGGSGWEGLEGHGLRRTSFSVHPRGASVSRNRWDRLLTFMVVALIIGLAGFIWFVPSGPPGNESPAQPRDYSPQTEAPQAPQDAGAPIPLPLPPVTTGSTVGGRPAQSGEPSWIPGARDAEGQPRPTPQVGFEGTLFPDVKGQHQHTGVVPRYAPVLGSAAHGGTAPGYRVQVGAFRLRRNAEELLGQLAAHGFTGGIVRDGLYRVWVGGPLERTKAQALAAQLEDAGFQTFIRRP